MVSFIEDLSQIFIASSGYFSYSFSKIKWRGSGWILSPASQCRPYPLLLLRCRFCPCLLPPQPGVQGCVGLEVGSGDGHHKKINDPHFEKWSATWQWLWTLFLHPWSLHDLLLLLAQQRKSMVVLVYLCQCSKPSHQCGFCRHLPQVTEGQFALSELLPHPACEKTAQPWPGILEIMLYNYMSFAHSELSDNSAELQRTGCSSVRFILKLKP